MSTRTALRPQPVITAAAMTGSITSAVTVLQGLSDVSYGYSWTGTSPVGTMSVQVSNTYALSPTGAVANAGTDWTTVPVLLSSGTVATSAPVTGNTGTGFFDITTGAYAIRTIYTFTSGSGTLNATVAGKVS